MKNFFFKNLFGRTKRYLPKTRFKLRLEPWKNKKKMKVKNEYYYLHNIIIEFSNICH